jgi:DNA-binding transcriptional ArsR family regulator
MSKPADRRDEPPTLAEIDAVFDALAHEARRHVVLLLAHSGGELPSGYLAARFQHSWPTTTRHLHVLERAGIVHVARSGRTSRYRLDRDRLRRVVGGWLRHVEPVDPQKTWPASGPRSTSALGNRSRNKLQKGPAR